MPAKTKTRTRPTVGTVKTLTDQALDYHLQDPSLDTDVVDAIDEEIARRRDAKDGRRIAVILHHFAEYIEAREGVFGELPFDEGVNYDVLTSEDLYRAAELLDPTTED